MNLGENKVYVMKRVKIKGRVRWESEDPIWREMKKRSENTTKTEKHKREKRRAKYLKMMERGRIVSVTGKS